MTKNSTSKNKADKNTKSQKPSPRKLTTQKSTTEKSSSNESTSSTDNTDSEQETATNQTFRIVIIVAVLALAGYYLWTGSDTIGQFSPSHDVPAAPPAVVGNGGDWWQVYFTDPQRVNNPGDLTGSVLERLIEYIDNAQHTIRVAAFEFDLEPVADALIAAKERGVDVQWVTDDEYGIEADDDEGRELFPKLERAGIEVRDDDRSALMHNTFLIFDEQKVWTGSTNLTVNGSFRNNNNVLVIYSRQVAAMYGREFEEMWAGEFGPTSPSAVAEQSANIDGTPVQVLFGAEDEVISNLILLIESAKDSIRFMAFAFTHDELGKVIQDRAKAGVDVMGIFEKRGSETEHCEMCALLYCVGADVRQDGNPRTFHHKVFVVDDEIVVTGSLNFSGNADDSNDENVVVVANRDIAAQYLQEFERRWAEAAQPNPEDLACDWEADE